MQFETLIIFPKYDLESMEDRNSSEKQFRNSRSCLGTGSQFQFQLEPKLGTVFRSSYSL